MPDGKIGCFSKGPRKKASGRKTFLAMQIFSTSENSVAFNFENFQIPFPRPAGYLSYNFYFIFQSNFAQESKHLLHQARSGGRDRMPVCSEV